MKNALFCIYAALFAAVSLHAQNNVITYKADKKLYETTSYYSGGLHTDAFNVDILKHSFKNGEGIITFKGDVTEVGENAFMYTDITDINLPNTVEEIGYDAFEGCDLLTEFRIPALVSYISSYAFCGCDGLVAFEVDTDNTHYTSIEGVLYNADTTSLMRYPVASNRTTFDIPNTVTRIESYAFHNSKNLTSVTIPNGVQSLSSYAFFNCTELTSLSIPASVRFISYSALRGCTNLISITVDGDSKYYASENGVLFNKFKTTLIKYPARKALTSYDISATVTDIEAYAFESSAYLQTVSIPNTVLTIGDEAFQYATALISVNIPNQLTEISSATFYGCTSLETIELPASVQQIGTSAFAKCSSLQSIHIPHGITEINYSTFSGDSALTSIKIPNSVEFIDNYAFKDCASLNAIDIPSSVTSIGDCAFYNCRSAEYLNLPNSVVDMGDAVFCGCCSIPSVIIPPSMTTIPFETFCDCSSLQSVTFPERVDTIEGYAFWGCSSLTSLDIPDMVSYIGEGAFGDCSSLTSFVIPESVKEVRWETFMECSSLQSIIIPDSVESIEYYAFMDCLSLQSIVIGQSVGKISSEAFSGCKALTDITSKSPYPPYCDTDYWGGKYYGCFDSVPTTATVHVPYGFAHRYRVANDWDRFSYPIDVLYENANNDSIVDAWASIDGEEFDKLAIRRPFYHDGSWNTICLPFSLDEDEIALSPLADCLSIQTITDATVIHQGQQNESLLLSLTDVTEIEAGMPYLVRWAKDTHHPVTDSLIFENVYMGGNQPDAVTLPNGITFRGIYSPFTVQAGDMNVLFVGANGRLNWPIAGGTIQGFRAFVEIASEAQSLIRHGMSACLSESRNTATDNPAVSSSDENSAAVKKCLEEGRVIILSHGNRYDLNGNLME